MDKTKKRNAYVLLAVLTAIAITLTALLIGFVQTYLYSIVFAVIAVMIVLYVVGVQKNIEWLYKFMLTCFYIGVVILALLLALVRSGVMAEFYDENGEFSSERISQVISGKKGAVFIFIALSFLQVTFLPIPSTILTVVGAALFGIGAGIAYSLIGQIIGSMVAFALGRFFGKKIIIWIVGASAFDKYNKIIKGRDKIVIFFMLLLPFFPDDLLCMFAGLTTFSWLGFFLLIVFSRAITVTYTSFGYGALEAVKNLGGWSYVIYIAFAVFVILVLLLVWKKGDVIEEKMLQLIDKITPKRLKKKAAENALCESDGVDDAHDKVDVNHVIIEDLNENNINETPQ